MGKKIDIPIDNNIISTPLDEAMPDNYLPYAVEVARDRALPDVRDGLKPVHRRILYGAYMLKAFPDKPYYKSARIVGDILGKYHPHGDTSVYDAMVILAQNFSTRMTLIDGHGNWGSQDGDSAAAMRYTEARLTPIALELLRDIEKDVVNMVDNYSGNEKEPEVLPARFPNLLVNGVFGIAVGLATNIPPHNLREVIDASLSYIDNPNITTRELMEYIKGPDLPTGGIIIGKNSLLSAYETGEGRVTMRAKTSIERLENGRLGIVITEFPFRRNKAKLLQLISEMTADKRHQRALEPISDIRDESDRTGVRSVIEFKKSADQEVAEKVLKYLYKKTDLQCNIPFNMVAIANGKPQTMGLKTIIKYYVEHQRDVVTKRTKRELQIALKRFEIVQGFIKAIGIMDEIIKTIRESSSKKDAQKNIMNKFGFSEVQSEAILELMLYRLTGLEIKAFEKEYKELEKEIKGLRKILDSECELLKVIKKQLIEISQKYGNERKTKIVEDDEKAKIDIEELIIEEDIMITMSNEGYIKRIPLKSYNRSNTQVEDIEYREGDFNKYLLQSNTKDNVLAFTDKGNMYQLRAVSIPEYKWKDKGEKIDTLIKAMDLNEEKIISVYSIDNMASQRDVLFFTDKGGMKKTQLDKFTTSYTKLMALKLRENEKLMNIKIIERDAITQFINVKTLKGLKFTIEEPKLEAVDRNIYTESIFNLCNSDIVENIEYTDSFEYKMFYLNISDDFKVKNSEKPFAKGINIKTDSSCKILIFDNKGLVYSLPSFMLQNIGEKDISLLDILDSNDSNIKILNVLSVNNFNEAIEMCFFTRLGMVKKTILKEFEGNSIKSLAYKLRTEEDTLIGVLSISDSSKYDLLIVTRKGMCIRIETSDINLMGRVASGVIGISLIEDDVVIFGDIVAKEDNKAQLILKSSQNNLKKINLKDIKIQNRAGRGKNIMLVVMNEYIKYVEKKK